MECDKEEVKRRCDSECNGFKLRLFKYVNQSPCSNAPRNFCLPSKMLGDRNERLFNPCLDKIRKAKLIKQQILSSAGRIGSRAIRKLNHFTMEFDFSSVLHHAPGRVSDFTDQQFQFNHKETYHRVFIPDTNRRATWSPGTNSLRLSCRAPNTFLEEIATFLSHFWSQSYFYLHKNLTSPFCL